jgi:hypothetical protein
VKSKLLYWIPRVLVIFTIVFMMLFSFNCYEGSDSLRTKIICFLMHNLPIAVCLVALIIAWRWEFPGGILFCLIFIAASIFFRSFKDNPASLIITTQFLITGILFLIHYYHKEKKNAV